MELIDKSKFKTKQGYFLTQSLFVELHQSKTTDPVYTLKEYDTEIKGVMYPSLKRLYLEFEDITEYEFAKTYLYSWEHWERVSSNAVLKRHVDSWRRELEVKLRSKGLKGIIDSASSGNYQANKTLLERGWLDKVEKKNQPDETKSAVEDSLEEELGQFLKRVK